MKTDTWFFLNTQTSNQILQPEFKTPRTHLGIFMENDEISSPLTVSFSVHNGNRVIVSDEITISSINDTNDLFEIKQSKSYLQLLYFCDDINEYPDKIEVSCVSDKGQSVHTKHCEYFNIYGRITDFGGKPFPAVVCFYRHGFSGDICAWSDSEGFYSIKVPAGRYNAVFCDDASYNETTLENWCWNMYVDRDEEHNLKIGNGEVYSLTPWTVNGGLPVLMFYFRPMILGEMIERQIGQRKVIGNNIKLSSGCVTVYIDGEKVKNYGFQRIFENTENISMPAYIIQTEKPEITPGKHTAIVEFDSSMNNSMAQLEMKTNHYVTVQSKEDDCIGKAQGRVQFFYTDSTGTYID